ncbi:von Willebrand factor A domain-containing protein 7-like [Notolabrus celidotus]|uniref:von Willebrand factor A domain-containing protein 7-like n=1 Tax=Notolabrus celidotus TaxID=1203425 RepID=UPI00148F8687|nr:von Willebrand factor A domain-containing protein 7-like [Notolabrus celidotus]XP_034538689.1 von Willebrand factor A domain-containing protein 7-like [Notolabrus celidotus]XP_034538690.1 von Willebrand factor A domain-containing protein 7-like [Notolabrus celidotus]XP_034538691.1 von Willebrand factor A domain-containing protein 7-like [Notolabrus celidotus]XP_034538693.1 von Willebrand factor A domain-containing protein 7-like [Notolabrus celidotus]XP_034538694.1 von Willebrand factor A d
MSERMITLCVLLMLTGAQGFGILPGDSMSHLEITEAAILNVTVQVCRALAAAEGADFSFPAQPFTVEGVAVACGTTESRKTFRRAIRHIIFHNVRVDLRHALNASFHFDEEMFDQGRNIISQGIEAIKASNEQENYETARQKLGEIIHPLQDFYSHSNWVELKNKLPNSNLLRSGVSIGNLADESRATCRSCDGDNCTNNILEDIIQEKVLTSGYFGIVPISSTKPKGKCSHGGAVDQTSTIEPTGGINKDSFDASHGHLHTEAAKMATAATSELLEDIRSAAGDRPFLQMMGLSKGSNKALCFVIDTTKSMSDEIEAVRTVTTSIIDSEVGTENEPATYILVPFNDPEFGPLIRTTDPKILEMVLNSISIGGGGDEQELSLSGLQLALGGAPFNSEVFLFTDGPAKDANLKNSVTSLIERTQTVVNFIISTSTSPNSRRRRRDDSQQQQSRITASDAQLYRELAQTSGGQMVEVTKTELTEAASIISDTLDSSLVMLLQAARSPGKDDAFSFIVDDSITNPTVYITGSSVTFTLTSPTGESQQSTDATGSLITSSRSVGNLQSLQLRKITGSWEMKMMSTNPYTIKAIGKSPIDFLFDFVEKSQGPFQGYDALDSRPRAGVNGSLLVSFTGSDTATVTEVALVESWGSEEIKGAVQPQGSGNFLVLVDRIPSAEFAVRVKGEDSSSGASMVFQRQSRTNFRSSNLTINADSDGIIDPLTPFSVPFSVMANGAGGNFTIRATNNQLFPSTFPTSLLLETGKTANGTVTLSAPRTTPSGTDVTLTIEAEAPDGEDVNYIVLRSTVINTITDFIQPECQLLTRQSNCSGSVNCSSLMWMIFVRVTDGAEGTGVDHVRLLKGNGTIIIEPAADNKNVTMVLYTSACCSPEMELVVVDKIGNVGTCFYSSDSSSSAALSKSIKVAEASLLVLCIFVFGQQLLTELGLR